MTVQERLKILYRDRDPLLKSALSHELALIFNRNNSIKLPIRDKILKILHSIYNPLGMWQQNPDDPFKTKGEDLGVIINNEWDPLMQADTNYSGWVLIFNECNKFLLKLYKENAIETIEINSVTFSYKEQIQFLPTDTLNETLSKIDKIFILVEYLKKDIFMIGTKICEQLRDLYRKTMNQGDEAQSFYLKDINYFFEDIDTYVSSKGRGDKNDRKEGVDVWKTHNDGKKTTDQVKSCCDITKLNDGYLINFGTSKTCRADYYVFVCHKSKIMIFKNQKDQLKFNDNGVFFPNELLYKEKKYE